MTRTGSHAARWSAVGVGVGMVRAPPSDTGDTGPPETAERPRREQDVVAEVEETGPNWWSCSDLRSSAVVAAARSQVTVKLDTEVAVPPGVVTAILPVVAPLGAVALIVVEVSEVMVA